ncbi:transposable element Tcb2 transposase [Trichonephila clavipes]|nr:transposable element Tcb2 transposase [Trichonephila clavipes]
MKRNSSTVIPVWKQWTDEQQTTRKTGSEWTTEGDASVRRSILLRMAVNDRTAFSRQLASHESRFNSWNHDGRIHVRRYPGERCLSECVIERHIGLTSGVMVWGAISYHGRSILLRIEAQHMLLLSWSAYSADMSPIKHGWDLVDRRFTRDPRSAASKDELLLCIQAIWNSLPQADIQNLFDFMPRRTATLLAALGGYTKY